MINFVCFMYSDKAMLAKLDCNGLQQLWTIQKTYTGYCYTNHSNEWCGLKMTVLVSRLKNAVLVSIFHIRHLPCLGFKIDDLGLGLSQTLWSFYWSFTLGIINWKLPVLVKRCEDLLTLYLLSKKQCIIYYSSYAVLLLTFGIISLSLK